MGICSSRSRIGMKHETQIINICLQKTDELLVKARQVREDNNYEDAFQLYEQGIQLAVHYWQYVECKKWNEHTKKSGRHVCQKDLEIVQKLRGKLWEDLQSDLEKYTKNLSNHDASCDMLPSTNNTGIENENNCYTSDQETLLRKCEGATLNKKTELYLLIKKAVGLVTLAVEEDYKRNYAEALRLYEHGIECFFNSFKYETQSERVKESIRNKCAAYLDRAEKINEYLNKNPKTEACKSWWKCF